MAPPRCRHVPARQAGDRGHNRAGQLHSRNATAFRLQPVSPPAFGHDARCGPLPRWRMSPRRSPCATANHVVALWTSHPMNVPACIWSLSHSQASAPAHPAQPPTAECRKSDHRASQLRAQSWGPSTCAFTPPNAHPNQGAAPRAWAEPWLRNLLPAQVCQSGCLRISLPPSSAPRPPASCAQRQARAMRVRSACPPPPW